MKFSNYKFGEDPYKKRSKINKYKIYNLINDGYINLTNKSGSGISYNIHSKKFTVKQSTFDQDLWWNTYTFYEETSDIFLVIKLVKEHIKNLKINIVLEYLDFVSNFKENLVKENI